MKKTAKKVPVRAHVFVYGRVQGVEFRDYTRYKARMLNLSGWVRNLVDGSVEAIFEGQEEAVHQAIDWCRAGTPSAQVRKVEVEYEAPTGDFNCFHIAW